MNTPLYPYYEAELHFIRELAQEFAQKYPVAAARLKLESDRSSDPHVERLIEAFALLAGRVRHKLHDEFPELTEAMLSVLYPHALAPIPSLGVVQFALDAARGAPGGVPIAAGSRLHTARVGDQECRYRTCYPVTLWPIAVTEARLRPPPFPAGMAPPPAAVAALHLRLQATGELTLDQMQLGPLRFHLLGDGPLTSPLYDLLFQHALGVSVRSPARPGAALDFTAGEAIAPVGFGEGDALWPYPPNVFPGYRLLAEYFAYPAKFLFVDLLSAPLWRRVRELGPARHLDVVVFLGRSHARLEHLLNEGHFRLGCTPVVNLFEQTAEPIPFTHTRPEYRVTPVVGRPAGYEVYSVESVTAAGANGADREFRPFYHFHHGQDRETARAFWYAARRPSQVADDRGTDVTLQLVDASFDPASAGGETLVVRTLCTNRDLPTRLPRVGEQVPFEAAFSAPGVRVRAVRNPTGSQRPAAPPGRYWHLISHLNLNHLALTADAGGTEALTSLLRLYDLTDPEAEPQAAALARQSIEGVVRVGSRRVTAWMGAGDLSGFARGLEVTLELDETKFVSGSGFLFAAVLERFFGLYVSVNSFTQLVARYRQQDGDLKRWPPRAGDRPLG